MNQAKEWHLAERFNLQFSQYYMAITCSLPGENKERNQTFKL